MTLAKRKTPVVRHADDEALITSVRLNRAYKYSMHRFGNWLRELDEPTTLRNAVDKVETTPGSPDPYSLLASFRQDTSIPRGARESALRAFSNLLAARARARQPGA